MTSDGESGSTMWARSGDKASILLAIDQAMLGTAIKYDLDRRPERYRSNRALMQLFFDLAAAVKPDLFVEAGAKEASASRHAKRLFKQARVVAFEANPYTYEKFRPTNDGTGIEYLHTALSDHSGPITFHVLRDDDGRPRSDGQSSLLKRNRGRDQERGFDDVTVEATTLDEFFADQEFENAVVWMDVEGAAKFVLAGADKLLARTALIIVEVEDRQFWGPDHWLREQVVSHLYDRGLVPVARDFEYEFQYNYVFVRADLLAGQPKIRSAITRFASAAVFPDQDPRNPQAAAAAKAPAPKSGQVADLRTRLVRRARPLARRIRNRLRARS